MARSTIHFAVPEAVRRYVEERVKADGYKTVSEYLRLLIREDRQRHLNSMQSMSRRNTSATSVFRPLASSARRQK